MPFRYITLRPKDREAAAGMVRIHRPRFVPACVNAHVLLAGPAAEVHHHMVLEAAADDDPCCDDHDIAGATVLTLHHNVDRMGEIRQAADAWPLSSLNDHIASAVDTTLDRWAAISVVAGLLVSSTRAVSYREVVNALAATERSKGTERGSC